MSMRSRLFERARRMNHVFQQRWRRACRFAASAGRPFSPSARIRPCDIEPLEPRVLLSSVGESDSLQLAHDAFDFGTTNSPIESGFEPVTPATTYSAQRGYGWLPGSSVKAQDRAQSTGVERDFNAVINSTFVVDLPDGRYVVDTYLGDTRKVRDKTQVTIEGEAQLPVTTMFAESAVVSTEVEVLDGQLTLRIQDLGGTSKRSAVQAVTVTPVVDASDPIEPASAPTHTWVAVADGDWEDGGNWQSGEAPHVGDDVVINAPGVTVTINSDVDVNALTSTANLIVASGSLTIRDVSQIDGDLTVAPATTLTADGATTVVTVNGAAVVDSANLIATNGAELLLPTVASMVLDRTSGNQPTIRAEGAGSLIDLSNATNLTQAVRTDAEIEALSGGTVDLSGVTSIDIAAGGFAFQQRDINVTADGPSSLVDLSGLTNFNDLGPGRSVLSAVNGGEIRVPIMTTAVRVDVTLDGTGTFSTAQITDGLESRFVADGTNVDLTNLTNLENGELSLLNGGTMTTPNISNIDDAQLYVADSVTLSLPAVTTARMDQGDPFGPPTWRATGAGSTIDLSNVTNLTQTIQTQANVEALAGGTVDLSAVNSIDINTGGFNFQNRNIHFTADGANSLVDLSILTAFNDNGPGRSILSAVNGGEIDVANMTAANRVDITLDGTGTLATSQIIDGTDSRFVADGVSIDLSNLTTLANGELTLRNGGTTNAPNLANIDDTQLFVSNGVTLSLPAATTARLNQSPQFGAPVWQATHAGSVIDLPNVTNLTQSTETMASIAAFAGGLINLPGVTSIDIAAGGFNFQERDIHVMADGSGSEVNLSGLTAFNDAGPGRSRLSATDGGEVDVQNMATANRVDVTVDGTGTLPTSQIVDAMGSRFVANGTLIDLSNATTLFDGELSLINGGTVNAPNLANIDDTKLFVNDGVTLSLPAAVSARLNQSPQFGAPIWSVDGAGSALDVSSLTTMTQTTETFAVVQALNGGGVDLSALTTFDIAAGGFDFQERQIDFNADGVNSSIDISAVTLFNDQGPGISLIMPTNGGTIDLATAVTFVGMNILYDGTGTLNIDDIDLGERSLLEGSGVLTANVTNTAGTVDANATPGNLTIDGTFTQGPDGNITVLVGGPVGGVDFDQLVITGAAAIDGTFTTGLSNAFEPTVGDMFTVVTYPSKTGDFTAFAGLDAGAGVEFVPDVQATEIKLNTQFATGPSVNSAVFEDGTTSGGQPQIRITFDEAVDRATVRAEDVVVVGPGGPVTMANPFPVGGTNNTVYLARITEPALDPGLYNVTIGPDVNDFVGNAMNQDGDGTNGETPDDQFMFSFNLDLPDLEVESVALDTAAASFGDSVQVDWTVRNTGTVDATGTWSDRIYLSDDNVLNAGDTLLATVDASAFAPLVPTDNYSNSTVVTLPIDASLGDGAYFIIVETDSGNDVVELGEANNTNDAAINLVVPPLPDLVITPTLVPTNPESGSFVTLEWTTGNTGSAATTGGWTDRIYLSTNNTLSANDRLLTEVIQPSSLGPGGSVPNSVNVQLPIDFFGDDVFFLFVADDDDQQIEHAGEANNVVPVMVDIDLGPIADLRALDVTFTPNEAIGDPASITVDWTVENNGTGTGINLAWFDTVIASADNIAGNFDDRELARFANPQVLDVGESYSRSETFNLPIGFVGEFNIFVIADGDDDVFENGAKANNAAQGPGVLTAMPIPYADLFVTTVMPPLTAQSGETIEVSWVVENQGIGQTSTGTWTDRVYFATDAGGVNRIQDPFGDDLFFPFSHFGPLAPGGTYTRTGEIAVPNGFSGDLFVIVETAAVGGPFEFTFDNNNETVGATPIDVTLAPSPDLTVTNIDAPTSVEDGQTIDITWTVTNQGAATASGPWEDLVYLEQVTDPDNPQLLGTFTRIDDLDPGESFTRTERISLPTKFSSTHQLFVVTDHADAVYEDDNDNNRVADDVTMTVSLAPRADLEVTNPIVPANVMAGAALQVEFDVTNNGTADTVPMQWTDRVYLSLDAVVSRDDVLLGRLENQAALMPGESYHQISDSIVVPLRFRGDMFVLIVPDSDNVVDEFPNDDNVSVQPIFIDPQPLADLVVSDVILPTQATAGSTITVQWSLDNLGSGIANTGDFVEQVWLAADPDRPHPANGDILLETINRTGDLLDVNEGVDRSEQVTIPGNLPSGMYFILPWVDPFGAVLEDTLAINVNPDDPNEIDNNNYKGAQLDIIGVLPDLVVTDITPSTTTASGGDAVSFSVTVENQGTGVAPGGFLTQVFVTDNADPLADGARSLVLAEFKRDQPLGIGESFTFNTPVTLSPSANGQFFAAYADVPQLGFDDPFNVVEEVFEDNNATAVAATVTPQLADLVVTDVQFEPTILSGEPTVIRYTVENQGTAPVWTGTEFWRDFNWIGVDDTQIRLRSSFIGTHVQPAPASLAPGESYEVVFNTTIPRGLDGDYNLYINLNAHNDLPCLFFPIDCRLLETDWFPADTGSNDAHLSTFRRWAFEDPNNNLHVEPFNVTFNEPDVAVLTVTPPATGNSGQNITVDFSVTNQGTRATRGNVKDALFLSHDPSLDQGDLFLGQFTRPAVAAGETYNVTADVRLPDGIEGDFYIIAHTDTAASEDTFKNGPPSTIGFDLPGIKFDTLADEFIPFDMVDLERRQQSRGPISEFQNEGNNILSAPFTVNLTTPPDLQVTGITAPASVFAGQSFDVAFTVTNLGGDVPATEAAWDTLFNLSADLNIDLKADQFLDVFEREGVLAAGGSFTETITLTAPPDSIGDFNLFVTTDPRRANSAVGNVFEGNDERDRNNSASVPLTINMPPAVDLVIDPTSIAGLPVALKAGDAVQVNWTGQNISGETVDGSWRDAVFLSTDNVWDISDKPLGTAEFTGVLNAGQTYNQTLDTFVPAVLPGDYFLIVRADVLNQVFEGTDEGNNTSASDTTVAVSVDEIPLGVPFPTTLSNGQDRLYRIVVPANETLRVTLDASDDRQINELFLGQDRAPSGTDFDATYEGGLNSTIMSTLPSTEAGEVFVLVRGRSAPADDTPITLFAELLPLTITSVDTDTGGDSAFVTTTIRGAKFDPAATVELIRPGFGTFTPASHTVIDTTKIIASFDLTGAPHGLYDVKVTNPDGSEAIVPYRFLVERAVAPEVTIGVGGPRIVLAGDIGTYSVAVQGIANVDTPYVFFEVGIPEMGRNLLVYNLDYLNLNTNVGGAPDAGGVSDLPFASLVSKVNTDGHVLAPGYVHDQHAQGFDGFTFNVETYPGLRELNERAFDELAQRIQDARPDLAALGIPATPEELDLVQPGLFAKYLEFGAVPDFITVNFIPFQFHVVAAATAMTRSEFIDHSLEQVEPVRQAIVSDPTAGAALAALAADKATWDTLYLAALEEADLLRADGAAPPNRENAKIISLMATIAGGILVGPAGDDIIATDNVLDFFGSLRERYGHQETLEAPTEGVTQTSGNPIPALPTFGDYDLGLTSPTHFEAFNVYSPWIPFELRGAGLPPDFQISGVDPTNPGDPLADLDLSRFLLGDAGLTGIASITGPATVDAGGFIPVDQPLPYTVNFQNDPVASKHVQEVRIVADLDPNLDTRTFRLGDIRIGDINVSVPADRGVFQGDFDFVDTKGFILRVSAGVDLASNEATWLLQAIDPITGDLVTNPNIGLLPPNNALGDGFGFVGYRIQTEDGVVSGDQVSARARVIFNTAAPEDTQTITQTIDAVAPTTILTTTQIAGTTNFVLDWDTTDDLSGVKHVTLYAARDGGDFEVFQRQLPDATGSEVFIGQVGSNYEFLALATDIAGNREEAPLGVLVADDGGGANLGVLPDLEQTPPNYGIPPAPTADPSTNALFTAAEFGDFAAIPPVNLSEYDNILRPFEGRAFATGIGQSHANIGPMAIAERADGTIFVSGGPGRNELYVLPTDGGPAGAPLATLSHPIFNLAFDSSGNLWATTGGGPLLLINPDDGSVLGEFGNGLTIALAVDPADDTLLVGSNRGVERFDPTTQTFTRFSRDRDLRVGALAFDNNGDLWATVWPDRDQIVRFNARRRAEAVIDFDTPIDSISFGQAGTDLAGLLFVTHTSGDPTDGGAIEPTGSELTVIDTATLRQVAVGRDGSRGDVVMTTSDGRVLVSQSNQVDVLEPAEPPIVLSVDPTDGSEVDITLDTITVVYSTDMIEGDGTGGDSVINPANYSVVGDVVGPIAITNIVYDALAMSATLTIDALSVDTYTFTINNMVASIDHLTLEESFVSTFTVDEENLPPVANRDQAGLNEDTPIDLNVLLNDFDVNNDIDPSSVVIVDQPTNGMVDVDPLTGVVTYTPHEHVSGTDTFTYTVDDFFGNTSNIGTVDLTIIAVADAPTVSAEIVAGDQDTPLALNITAGLVDTDGSEVLTVRIVGVPIGSALSAGTQVSTDTYEVDAADLPGLMLTPPAGFSGDVTLSIIAVATEQSNGDTATTAALMPTNIAAVDPGPVEVVALIVNNGEAQRSRIHTLGVQFNQDVRFDDLVGGVRVVPRGGGAPLTLDASRYSYDPLTFILSIDVAELASADDQYDVQITPSTVHPAAALNFSLSQTDVARDDDVQTLSFFRLLADFTGDEVVDRTDQTMLLSRYRTEVGDPNYDRNFDLDLDGFIERSDYLLLRNQTRRSADVYGPDLGAMLSNDTGRDVTDSITFDPTVLGFVGDLLDVTSLQAGLNGPTTTDILGLVTDGEFTLTQTDLETINGGPLIDGDHTLSLVATDERGNVSDPFEFTFTLDRIAPAAPNTPDLATADDSGAFDNDDITNRSNVTVQVDSEIDALVRVFVDGGLSGQAIRNGGPADVSLFALNEGVRQVTATAEDVAGNISDPSAALDITIDQTDPAGPTLGIDGDPDNTTSAMTVTLAGTTDANASVELVTTGDTTTADAGGAFSFSGINLTLGNNVFTARATDLAGNSSETSVNIRRTGPETDGPIVNAGLAKDTGTSDSDNLTNDPTIVGTVNDASVVTTFRAGLNAAPTVDILSNLSGGVFTLSVTDLEAINGGPLAEGAHTLRLFAQDEFLNDSDVFEFTFTLDTVAPLVPPRPDLADESDRGDLDDDNVTSDTSPRIDVMGEDGTTILLFIDSVLDSQMPIAGGMASFTPTLGGGTFDITVQATDDAGNASGDSDTLTITIETGAPSQPTLDLTVGSDTPPLGDRTTDDEVVDLEGATDPSLTVRLFRTSDLNSPIASTASSPTGDFTFNTITLANGANDLTVVASDLAGNEASFSAVFTSNAPDTRAPVIDAALANDTGRSDSDGITFDATVVGMVDDASAIAALRAGIDALPTINILANLSGSSLTLTPADLATIAGGSLTEGTHTLSLEAEDAFGNTSSVFDLTFTLDTIRPGLPATPDLPAAFDTGTFDNDNVTMNTSFDITVDGEADGLLNLFVEGVDVGQTVLTGSPVDLPVGPLADGVHRISTQVADVAGNTSLFSTLLLLTVDTVGPATPVFGLDAASDTRPFGDNTTNLPNVRLFGSTEPNLAIELLETGATGTSEDDGSFAFGRISLPSLGDFDFNLQASDIAGNTTVGSTTVTRNNFIPTDLLRPEVTLEVSSDTNFVGDAVTVTLTVMDNVGVVDQSLTLDGAPLALTPTGPGMFEATINAADAGFPTLNATATDAMGNEGAASLEVAYFLNPAISGDVTPPTAILDNAGVTGIATLPGDITGTASDANFLRYTLELSVRDADMFVEIASGDMEVINDALGVFDPTLLENGFYEVRLIAIDTSGNSASATRVLRADGQAKIGEFSLSFEDINVFAQGFPVTLNRLYDSRLKSEPGDFGFGWTALQNAVSVTTGSTLGDGGFTQTVTVIEGGLSFVGFENTRDVTVSVTLPGGDVERFILGFTGFATNDPTPGPLVQTRLFFQPLPGTSSTLEALADNVVDVVPGDFGPITFRDRASGDIYNPSRWKLTTQDGRELIIDEVEGLESITDLNGNTLSFSDAGTSHSDGQAIDIQRDGEGRITSITDPLGSTIIYDYDFYGDLVAVTDQLGNVTRMTYDDSHRLLEIHDPLGQRGIRTEYDENGRVIATVDGGGHRTEVEHDLDGQREVITDRLGHTSVQEYDADGNVTAVTNALGHTTRYTYDANGNAISVTNPLGQIETRTYNSAGLPQSITDAFGNTRTFTYDAAGRPMKFTDARGNATDYEWDADGNLLSVTDRMGHTTTNTYDTKGRMTSTTDPEGNVTRMDYDAFGRQTMLEDANGVVTTMTYDGLGNLLTSTTMRTDSTGAMVPVVYESDYDAAGNLTMVVDPDGNMTEYMYDAAGRNSAITNRLGETVTFEYDPRNNLIGEVFEDGSTRSRQVNAEEQLLDFTDRLGNTGSYVYDAVGQVVSQTNNGETVQFEYDPAGRRTAEITVFGRTETLYDGTPSLALVQSVGGDMGTPVTGNPQASAILAPDGTMTEFAYDPNGNLIGIMVGGGDMTMTQYNANDLPTMTMFPDGTTAETTYDANNRSTGIVDVDGTSREVDIDPLGRITAAMDPMGMSSLFQYDELGNRTGVTDANGNLTRVGFNNQGLPTSQTLPLGQAMSYEYTDDGQIEQITDRNGNTTTYQYDGAGRVIQRTYEDGRVESMTYTDDGLLETATDPRGTTGYTYDTDGNITRVDHPDGTFIEYDYNDLGLVTTLTTPAGTTTYEYGPLGTLEKVTDIHNEVTEYEYDPIARITTIKYPNGVVGTHRYNEDLRPAEYTYVDAGGSLIESYQYTYDAIARTITVLEHDGRTVVYTYDDNQRLMSEQITESGGGGETISYTYDNVGNRLTRTDGDGTVTYTYDDNNRLLTAGGVVYTYDDQGNVTTRTEGSDVTTYTYDAANRLVQLDAPDGTVTQYEYDFAGHRVAKVVDGARSDYLIDTRSTVAYTIEERNAAGDLVVDYTYGLDLIGQNRAGDAAYMLTDMQGSTRMITDAAGIVTDSYTYDAFGQIEQQSGSTLAEYLFGGEQFDPESGLYHLRDRQYDPEVGRFTQEDRFQGISAAPATQNRYVYTMNDPVLLSDPIGQFGFIQFASILPILLLQVKAAVEAVKGFAETSSIVLSEFANFLNPNGSKLAGYFASAGISFELGGFGRFGLGANIDLLIEGIVMRNEKLGTTIDVMNLIPYGLHAFVGPSFSMQLSADQTAVWTLSDLGAQATKFGVQVSTTFLGAGLLGVLINEVGFAGGAVLNAKHPDDFGGRGSAVTISKQWTGEILNAITYGYSHPSDPNARVTVFGGVGFNLSEAEVTAPVSMEYSTATMTPQPALSISAHDGIAIPVFTSDDSYLAYLDSVRLELAATLYQWMEDIGSYLNISL